MYKFFKRVLDVFCSFIGAIVLLPVFIIIAISIFIDNPGPIFFKQKRVGKNKKLFWLHKFRSMKVKTPDIPTHLLTNPEQYITRVGRFLRKTSLDELPQIFDILFGKMSIIGPRPALWNQDDLIAERDKYGANDVKPGLTGWAQINGRDEIEIPLKAKLDGEYVEAFRKGKGFKMDVKCFFGTIKFVLKRQGVVEGGTGKLNENKNLTGEQAEQTNIVDGKGTKMLKTQFTQFDKKVWLSTPTMHGDEIEYIKKAYETNWMSTIGENINEIEKSISEKIGCKYAVALSSGTSAIHLAVKFAGVKRGDKVFCSDMTFDATVNPVVYEGGEPVFIDTEYDTWNMCPKALEKAFEIYPDVKVVVVAHLYGVPGKIDQIKKICDKHGAVIIEDAAESFGASYKGKQTGSFGTFNAISFNGNKIITGSSGGMLLTNSLECANKVRKWSTQARENAPWYQHEEIGYNYRMSNVIAGVVRGQLPYLEEHISQKKAIYLRYKEGLKHLPVSLNPYDEKNSQPNFWLSCMIIDKNAMAKQVRTDKEATFESEQGKSTPTEILQTLASYDAEGRPIWKPMHLQPIYKNNPFITINGEMNNEDKQKGLDVGSDIFERGLCLPSDNKMTVEEQDKVIEIIKACFE